MPRTWGTLTTSRGRSSTRPTSTKRQGGDACSQETDAGELIELQVPRHHDDVRRAHHRAGRMILNSVMTAPILKPTKTDKSSSMDTGMAAKGVSQAKSDEQHRITDIAVPRGQEKGGAHDSRSWRNSDTKGHMAAWRPQRRKNHEKGGTSDRRLCWNCSAKGLIAAMCPKNRCKRLNAFDEDDHRSLELTVWCR